MSTEDFLARCKKVKRVGPGRWICACPAHEDKHPSMNVREMPDGTTLVHCKAGCTQDAVVEATGLPWGVLFPTDGNETAYRREIAKFPARDFLEALAGEALLVAVAASNIGQGVELTAEDRARLMVAAERIMRVRTLVNGQH